METRKEIPWYEWLYQISNLWRTKSSVIKKIRMLPNWYEQTMLCKKSKKKYFYTHRLVAQAFISNPENKPQVNHKDWNRANNNVENLEWVTCWENHKHSYKYLWRKSAPICEKMRIYRIWKHNTAVSKRVLQIDMCWLPIKIRNSAVEASDWLWICRSCIPQTCRWEHKTAWGFIRKYI